MKWRMIVSGVAGLLLAAAAPFVFLQTPDAWRVFAWLLLVSAFGAALVLLIFRSFAVCTGFSAALTGGLTLFVAGLFARRVFAFPVLLLPLPAAAFAGILSISAAVRLFDRRDRFGEFGRFFRVSSLVFFPSYLFDLIYLLFLKNTALGLSNRYRTVNLVPFETFIGYASLLQNGPHFLGLCFLMEDTLGNLLLFLPFGFFLQVLGANLPRRARMALLVGVPAAAECLQFAFALGSADIDDMLFNACGGALGMLLCGLGDRLFYRLHSEGRLFAWR